MSITLQELMAAAKSIPASGMTYGRFLRVAIDRPVEAVYRYDPSVSPSDIHINTVEFEARPTTVHGHRAVAWYWHELLVKVTV